jgi:hypothetical protein
MCLDANVLEFLSPFGDVDRELVDALFAAGRTDDAPVKRLPESLGALALGRPHHCIPDR